MSANFLAETINEQEKLHDNWWIERPIFTKRIDSNRLESRIGMVECWERGRFSDELTPRDNGVAVDQRYTDKMRTGGEQR